MEPTASNGEKIRDMIPTDLDRFGIGETTDRLYFDGKALITESDITRLLTHLNIDVGSQAALMKQLLS